MSRFGSGMRWPDFYATLNRMADDVAWAKRMTGGPGVLVRRTPQGPNISLASSPPEPRHRAEQRQEVALFAVGPRLFEQWPEYLFDDYLLARRISVNEEGRLSISDDMTVILKPHDLRVSAQPATTFAYLHPTEGTIRVEAYLNNWSRLVRSSTMPSELQSETQRVTPFYYHNARIVCRRVTDVELLDGVDPEVFGDGEGQVPPPHWIDTNVLGRQWMTIGPTA